MHPSENLAACQRTDQQDTLCIGLDLAWFGGSAGVRDSQFDCIATAHIDATGKLGNLTTERVDLRPRMRDPQAEWLSQCIAALLSRAPVTSRVVLAIDAPLQTNQNHLPDRQARPVSGTVARRACDIHFNHLRKSIDRASGGARGWHPNIQPGAPLAPRVQHLLRRLAEQDFSIWSSGVTSTSRLAIECFPAEAIWAVHRLGHYPTHFTAARAKAYKAQQGCLLTEAQVRAVVTDALTSFSFVTATPAEWHGVVGHLVSWLLKDELWMKGLLYRGGKLLDDAVDATICLTTAIAYTRGCSHLWQDSGSLEDGHIIGPGLPEERSRLSMRPAD